MSGISDRVLVIILGVLLLALVALGGWYFFVVNKDSTTDLTGDNESAKVRVVETLNTPPLDGVDEDNADEQEFTFNVRSDRAVTQEGKTVEINVIQNDEFSAQEVDVTKLRVVTPPQHGQAQSTRADGTVSYTPEAGFVGQDKFTYELCNDKGECLTADVFVTVRAAEDGDSTSDSESNTVDDSQQSESPSASLSGESYTGATADDGVYINKYSYSYENGNLVFMWGVRGSTDPIYPSYTSGYDAEGDFIVTFPSVSRDLVISTLKTSPVKLGNSLPDMYFERDGEKSTYRFDVNDKDQAQKPTIERTIDPDDNKPVIKLTLPL